MKYHFTQFHSIVKSKVMLMLIFKCGGNGCFNYVIMRMNRTQPNLHLKWMAEIGLN